MQRLARTGLFALEIAILTGLILITRCANYREVFVAGNIYFADADCYARMTRVRMCATHPGLVVRHHDFENYPAGTNPHTTAPLDYFILTLSLPLRPLTAQPHDLAGALVSPLFALLTGWFLWWWSKRRRFRYRWIALILYAISPILVHGGELGRPDHQSLLVLLIAFAICAEWECEAEASRGWSVASGIAWGLAIWVSAYEPLLLLLLLLACHAVAWRRRVFDLPQNDALRNRPHAVTATSSFFSKDRRMGLIFFVAILAADVCTERRLPAFAVFASSNAFANWSHAVGELRPVSPLSPLWFQWAGFAIVILPVLIWLAFRRSAKAIPIFAIVFLVATYGLTIWQARWGYFFIMIFAILLPALFERIKSPGLIWTVFLFSIWPMLRQWDEKLWPSESELARRVESRNESMQLRDLSVSLQSQEVHPFLAPWWLSPSITYWSKQPGVAGSSHESLDGIVDSARFFLAQDWQTARDIVENHKITWVVAYDADRTATISALILGQTVPEHALCYVLGRAPAQAPPFLVFSAQNATAKIFRAAPVANNR